ncbi:1-deoxy-D-xylulose-5-phosphate reductoisomerase [Actinospica sp. MGRD01-02]|uniref:1-deoxy-D-xylulose 5-phosphate reductoisomerase n=1 Tax=Actinospica acidithermotolerans TaxID=2828514 RepID=A0A941IH65_9ACTN|nr:1-deoxy-D-xylulose-5-phosphate reductoisomerase [Actinospica acidithermotolerans]MBR7824863.1 1-deoxy-D-xylulose-5-phosphate reductoisomerase [Actinospica acidithermotolerans]
MTSSSSSSPRRIVILGSTGSIGTQAIDVVLRNPDRFRVVALAAGGKNPRLLAQQALDLGVEAVAVAKGTAAEDLQLELYAEAQRRGYSTGDARVPRLLAGPDSVAQLAAYDCDVVLNGIEGAAGLLATLAALKAGRTLALANKESLIIGGDLVTSLAAPGQIVAVDSEHSALAQCLRGGAAAEVRKLIVTASGGPFRGRKREELHDVTPDQALAHPTWAMGPLVTINSATLVNKGLEVIEAHLLYDVPFDRIEVVVHPTSVVHSMVEFADGSTLAQASPPDMRIPIALGMGWPERVADAAPACDWTQPATWQFFPLDNEAFPAVELAKHVGEQGGTSTAVFNGANEACVYAFLEGRIPFTAIVDTVAAVVAEHEASPDRVGRAELSLEAVLAADAWSRERAAQLARAN